LPYADAQFDLVVAAASLHYARDLTSAIAEAARVLRPGGALVLLDTPIYNQARTGWGLAEQRLASQWRRYGSDGAGTAGPGFVERAALRRYMRRAGLGYREVPLHGTLRSLLGRARRSARALVGRQERAQMPLVVGYKP
jgi:SAM-dependent methyltransferase